MQPQRISLPRFIALVLLFIPCLMNASQVDAATFDDVSRFVLVSTFVDASGVSTGLRAEGEQSDVTGVFNEAVVDGVGFGDFSNATGEAVQDSEVRISALGELWVDGGGAAGAVFDVNDPGFSSRAQVTADSRLSILFTLDETSPFTFAFSLSAGLAELSLFAPTGGVQSDVTAYARLLGATSGVLFEFDVSDVTVGDGGLAQNFSMSGVLEPDAYLLDVYALTELRGFEDASGFASSGFGVSFHVVPEPGVSLLLGLGLLGLSRWNRPAANIGTPFARI